MKPKKTSGPSPNYTVWATSGHQKGVIGAAWVNAEGEITVKLNPFTVLNATMTIKMYQTNPDEPVNSRVLVESDEPTETRDQFRS